MKNFSRYVPIIITFVIIAIVLLYEEKEPVPTPITNNDVEFQEIKTLPELSSDITGLYSFNYTTSSGDCNVTCDGYFLFVNGEAILNICKNIEVENKKYLEYDGQIGDNDGITCLSIQHSYKSFIEYRVDDYSDENNMKLYLLTQNGKKCGISGNNEVGMEIVLTKENDEAFNKACEKHGIEINEESGKVN